MEIKVKKIGIFFITRFGRHRLPLGTRGVATTHTRAAKIASFIWIRLYRCYRAMDLHNRYPWTHPSLREVISFFGLIFLALSMPKPFHREYRIGK